MYQIWSVSLQHTMLYLMKEDISVTNSDGNCLKEEELLTHAMKMYPLEKLDVSTWTSMQTCKLKMIQRLVIHKNQLMIQDMVHQKIGTNSTAKIVNACIHADTLDLALTKRRMAEGSGRGPDRYP